ncbi:hypothetical protein C0992_002426 [Termitomyces sp. T32_za158]|nr:hypothetical protein C0992_002426 [Termitomyces sp. T32_za158]
MFTFSLIGQPPQLLKRMGAKPPFEFKHSPTPMYMDLQYPSRAGTPWTSAETSPAQPTLQQRLESTNYPTNSTSDGHHLPMEVSADLTERKSIIDSGHHIMSPFQSFNESTSPPLKQTASLHSSLTSHEPQVSQAPFSNTHTTMAIQCSSLSTMPSSSSQTGPTSESLSSISGSETLQSSKPPEFPQINSEIKSLYESALIAFEKAELGLESAQETYGAAKATLTAIVTRFPQALAADAYQQHTSKVSTSRSPPSSYLGDSADLVITEVSRDITQLQTWPVIQKQPIQRLNHTTLTAEQRGFVRRITEIEQEADDVRMAWSSLSAERSSITSSTLGTDESSHMRSSLKTSAGSSPDTQSASVNAIADSTNIVKDEDEMDDRRALGRETAFQHLSSDIPRLIDSASSHISIDHEVCRKSPRAPVLDSSRLVEEANLTQAPSFPIPTVTQGTTTTVDSSGCLAKGAQALNLALRGRLHNFIESDGTAEDDNPADSDHTRSESNPISLGEDVSNELEIARELDREDAALRSSSMSRDVSRSSSIHLIDKLYNTVDEEVLQTKVKLSSDLKEEQISDRDSSTIHGSSSEFYRSSVLPSSQVDNHSLNESSQNSLLRRLQPSVSILSSSKTLGSQSESVAGHPSLPPSVLGKRHHFDPPSPRSQPSIVLPSKRRQLNKTERNDPPSLESRISEAFAPTSEPMQSNSPTSPIHYHGEHASCNENSNVPRNNVPSVERSISPPSGPRASRQEKVHSKHGSAAPSRPLSVNYRPPVDRQLGVKPDCYPNKQKGKGPRKRYVHDGPSQTFGYDEPSGRRGTRQNPQNSDSSSGRDGTAFRRLDARTRPSPSARRGTEQISLADRLRDP